MSSGLNKEWLNDDNIDSEGYHAGICSFVLFLIRKSGKDEYHPCPCRKCLNGSGQFNLDDISVHLLNNGMDKSYILWYFHGEHEIGDQRQDASEAEALVDNAEVMEHDVLPTSDPLISDSSIEGIAENILEASCQPATHKETKYEGLKRLAKRPLYLSSRKASSHSVMQTLVKLNDLKTEFNLSNSAIEGVIGLLKEVLPKGNTLGSKFHEMKCTLKEVELTCITYDVCENNCMLFWKEHINATHCTKCKLSRYKTIGVIERGNLRAATTSSKRKRAAVNVPKFKKVARKVMRYFPIIPRLQRLYSIKWISEAMTWHYHAESCGEFMRHPRDSADWTSANNHWKEFAQDPRSVRLALATDGFSPYGCFGSPYSCWPVILQPLNMPPSLTMKSEFSMLTVLIPGPHSPKSSMDVFLQPLIEDLILLWKGVDTDDINDVKPFKLKAMLLWCIHDFPAYGMMSGCVTQGKVACPICGADTRSQYLGKSRKCCFLYSRMFLPMGHCFRFDTSRSTYNGLEEHALAPRKLDGSEVEEITSCIGDVSGASSQYNDTFDEDETPISTRGFTRRSGLFDLPYWGLLQTRHNLDLMHVEKNVTENLLNIILAMKGSKDTSKAREDLEEMKLKRNLWLTDLGEMPEKPPFVLSKEDKIIFLSTLKTLRAPSGFSSSFSNSVNVLKKTFHFKSHDYHMIMQHLLPMLLMHAFAAADKPLFKAIQRISIFFNVLCAKVLSRTHLTKAKRALVEAICVLERYFPPSFFVIMIHLMHHLGDEALVAGPPRFRSMWTFEREMQKYKKWSRNKRYIEGSIAEAYLLHEASLYAMEYISVTGKGTHKRNRDSLFDEEGNENLERHVGKAVKLVLNATQFVQVRKWVLQQHPDYDEWRSRYDLTGRLTPNSTWKYAVDDFIIWLGKEAENTGNTEMMQIVDGPDYTVDSYNRFQCNGYSFSTVAYDGNKLVQNSGVSMKAYNCDDVLTTYYGVIKGIFDLNYHETTIAVFYCDWVSSVDKTAFKVDPLSKLVMVNLKKLLPADNIDAEPFILASQASQVFYCSDTKFNGWSVVIPSPKRLTKSIDALKIDPTMYSSIIEENERLCGLLDPIDG